MGRCTCVLARWSPNRQKRTAGGAGRAVSRQAHHLRSSMGRGVGRTRSAKSANTCASIRSVFAGWPVAHPWQSGSHELDHDRREHRRPARSGGSPGVRFGGGGELASPYLTPKEISAERRWSGPLYLLPPFCRMATCRYGASPGKLLKTLSLSIEGMEYGDCLVQRHAYGARRDFTPLCNGCSQSGGPPGLPPL